MISILYVSIASEAIFYISETQVSGRDWDLYLNVHNPYRVQAELYYLFDALLNNGLKDFYCRIKDESLLQAEPDEHDFVIEEISTV